MKTVSVVVVVVVVVVVHSHHDRPHGYQPPPALPSLDTVFKPLSNKNTNNNMSDCVYIAGVARRSDGVVVPK